MKWILQAVPHETWINQARQHWREHQPTRFRQLQASGELDAALTAAAEDTSKELQALMAQGFNFQEAWESVREEHLFPPEEKGASPEAPPSEGYRAMVEFHQALASLRMPGERED